MQPIVKLSPRLDVGGKQGWYTCCICLAIWNNWHWWKLFDWRTLDITPLPSYMTNTGTRSSRDFLNVSQVHYCATFLAGLELHLLEALLVNTFKIGKARSGERSSCLKGGNTIPDNINTSTNFNNTNLGHLHWLMNNMSGMSIQMNFNILEVGLFVEWTRIWLLMGNPGSRYNFWQLIFQTTLFKLLDHSSKHAWYCFEEYLRFWPAE